MRKQITLLLLVLFFLPISLYASDGILLKNHKSTLQTNYFVADNYSVNSESSDYNLALMNLQIDPLGFLFFGPQITLDFQFANMIAVGPYFRYHYAGLIYQGVVTDWFSDETTTSPASYSFGFQGKFLIPVGTGQHRPYVEVGYERSIGSDSWDPGGTWGRRIYEYKSNVIHFNAGYRLLTNSSFNISAAIGIGISTDTESIGYYEFGDDPTDYYPLETRILPMVQLLLGWQVGN